MFSAAHRVIPPNACHHRKLRNTVAYVVLVYQRATGEKTLD